ncbi:MAG: 16S rRNA (guanine(966)-N(2))-methyltransferase RsmD [Chloroflexi bacterium]|nr:16S rRNA (guanine(966)-N(2))-methyltransferase RsmD [Chloroflexota bacterium]
MRVIGGEAKGRRLFSVPGQTTRPITDRVKEALFDILAGRVQGARFLDLFAGTGGVGIEALSRGAEEAVFVERDERALATLRRNLAITQLASRARVVRRDVFKFIANYEGKPFDIIYVAPPQYQGLWAKTLQELDHSPLLAPGTLVIAQIHPKEYEPLELRQLALSDQRQYGSTLLCFYQAFAHHTDGYPGSA